jgi:hypothetical protein
MAHCRPDDLSLLLDRNYTLPQLKPDSPIPANHVRNELEWHQMCAIASLLHHFFQPTAHCVSGMLIANDVGVGKTLENYGSIAALVDILDCVMAGNSLPELLGESSQ